MGRLRTQTYPISAAVWLVARYPWSLSSLQFHVLARRPAASGQSREPVIAETGSPTLVANDEHYRRFAGVVNWFRDTDY